MGTFTSPKYIGILVIVLLLVSGAGLIYFQQKSKKPQVMPEPTPIIFEDSNSQTSSVDIIEVEGGMFYFKPNIIRVKAGEEVTIKFTNKEGMHDFVIDELGVNSGVVSAGKTKEITFTPKEVGEYEYYCSVGNHRAQGMVGKLIVE